MIAWEWVAVIVRGRGGGAKNCLHLLIFRHPAMGYWALTRRRQNSYSSAQKKCFSFSPLGNAVHIGVMIYLAIYLSMYWALKLLVSKERIYWHVEVSITQLGLEPQRFPVWFRNICTLNRHNLSSWIYSSFFWMCLSVACGRFCLSGTITRQDN